jgi:hypothetical protein
VEEGTAGRAAGIFELGGKKAPEADEDTMRALRAKIGNLAMVNDFFVRRAQALDRKARRGMIEKNHLSLSIGAQCRLLSISRSSSYHAPKGETVMNFDVMLLIGKQFLDAPFLRCPADDLAPAKRGSCRDRETRQAADAHYAIDADLSEA